jgi:phage/plasmid-associated DNA primase
MVSEPNKIDWTNLNINEEWFAERVEALTPGHLERLCELRGLPKDKVIDAVTGGIGWDAGTKSWVLPLRNIHGQIHMAKLWRPTSNHRGWIHAGRTTAMKRQKDGPVGRIFDLGWIVDESPYSPPNNWLWITAGEWDCVMLRCFGWLATTSVHGEGSKPQSTMLLREFGDKEMARAIFKEIAGIAVCLDADGAGHIGAVQFCDSFEQLFDHIGVEIPVRAIDLRQMPGYKENGEPSGWDVSDLVRWAKSAGVMVGAKLRGMTQSAPNGSAGAREMFDISEDISSRVTFDDVARPTMHTLGIDEIIQFGIAYGKAKNSRAQGAWHSGMIGRKKGWLFNEFIAETGHEKYATACTVEMPKSHPFTADDAYKQIARGFAYASRGGSNNLMNDVANGRRFAHLFGSFFKVLDTTDRWRYWDGTGWSTGEHKAVDHAMLVADYIEEEASRVIADDPALGKLLYAWANKSRTWRAVKNILAAAKESTMCRLEPELGEFWNGHRMHIGTPAGVFSLLDKELTTGAAARDMYCSMTTRGSIMVDDAAGHARWGDRWEIGRKFWQGLLESWQQGEDGSDVVRMLRQMAGLCLRGQLDERWIVLQGSGRSGKSTLLDGMEKALGDYAYEAAGDVFVRGTKANGGTMRQSTMAQMAYKRMIKTTEVGGRTIDTDTLKQLTGESTFTGKFLYKDPSVTVNHGTYFMMTNTEIDLRGDISEALRGRLIIVPFNTSFVDHARLGEDEYSSGIRDGSVMEKVDEVKARVLGSVAGWEMMHDVIITWMYEGLMEVIANDGRLFVASSVHKVTTDMWASNDVLGQYWSESGFWQRDGGVTVVRTAWLAGNVKAWAEVWDPALAESVGSAQKLAELLKTASARGYEKIKTTKYLGGPGKQQNCWKVPYTYIGPELHEI